MRRTSSRSAQRLRQQRLIRYQRRETVRRRMSKKVEGEVRKTRLLALGHYQPKAKDRKTTSRTAAAKFKRVDTIIDQIYCDICNGLTRDDILTKVSQRMYEGQTCTPKRETGASYY